MHIAIANAARAAWCGLLLSAVALSSGAVANTAPQITSTPMPVAVVGGEYKYSATATDADGDSIGFAVVTAPPGFSYDSHQHAFVWRPAAADVGDRSVTIRAGDASGAATTQTFTLHVLDAFCPLYPIALPDSLLASATSGQVFNQVPRGTGAGNYSWLTWGGSPSEPVLAQSLLPPGDSYAYINPDNNSDHRLDVGDWAQGGPGNTNGAAVRTNLDALLQQDIVLPVWSATRGQGNGFDYRVQRFATVRLTDYRLTGHGWLSFEFRGFTPCYNQAPTAKALDLRTDEDAALSVTLQGTDPEGAALSYEITSQPQHGTLSGTVPQLVYTPAHDFNGEDGFDYRVSDGVAQSAIAHVRITVRPVNDPPTADTQQFALDEDTTGTIVLHGADVDGDVLTYVIDVLPQHGSISGTAPNLVYTPTANYNGPDTIRFHTHDGKVLSSLATVDLTVRPVNDAPSADGQQVTLDEDATAAIVLHGTDVDGDALTYVIDSLPQHGAVSGTAPNLTYVPTANYNGSDSIRFHAYDGKAASSSVTVSITVRSVNDPPTADDQQLVLDEDMSAPLVLSGHDIEGDALQFRIVEAPQHGILSGAAPNLRYVPAADFNGTDRCTFRVNDGQLDSALATVTLTVRPVNDAPRADDKAATLDRAGWVVISLSGSDVDGDALTFRALDAPAHGTLSGTAPNLRYTANAAYGGSDEFHYVANDGTVDSAPATVRLQVAASNHVPTITSIPLTSVRSDTAYQYDVDASDADDDALQYSLVTAPAGMSINAQSGLIAWTPSGAGSFAVSVRVSDGHGGEATQAFTLSVSAQNRPPSFTSQPLLQATRGEPYRYDAQAQDPDQDVLAFNLDQAPAGMHVDAASGRIEWTPADNQLGSNIVRLRVSDGRGGEALQDFAISVIAVNRSPHITSVPVVIGVAGSAYRYDVDATDPDGDALSYRLLNAPSGMSIDAQSGLITWLPSDDQLAAADVSVQVTDAHGATDDQVFRVIVNADLVGHSHVGREFWFTHNLNHCTSGIGCTPADSPDRSHWVTIAALDAAQGYVEIPGLSFRQDFSLGAGGIAEFKLPWQVMNQQAFQPVNLGVHVVSDRPVTVVSMNRLKNTTDAAVIYPVEVLGNNYTIIDYPGPRDSGSGGQATILATQDNTRVTLLPPRGKNLSLPPASQLTQTLQRGQAFLLAAPGLYDPYSGLRVQSSLPVAVFGGNACANVPFGMPACDHLFEQMLPDRNLGQHFLAGRLATRRVGNMYRFVATEDNTAVYANEHLVAVLQAGESSQRVVDGTVAIRASKPIQALLLALGEHADSGQRDIPPGTPVAGTGDLDGDLLDPFSLALPPTGTELSDYLFTTPQVAALTAHYVSLVVPESAVSGLTIDGAPVAGVTWSPVPGSGKVYGVLQVSAGRHRLRAAAPFEMLVYGYGLFESYGYTGGLLIGDQDRVRLLEVTPAQQSRTAGDNACFNLVARDEARRRVPYARFLVRVDGAMPRAEAGYFDGTGHGEYCFSQPFTGRSTLVFQSGFAQTEATVDWMPTSDGVNRAPVFTSLPSLELHEASYAYDAHAVDPNGDVMQYVLVQGPSGAQLDAQSGQLRWTPPVPADRATQIHTFVIRARDPQGLYAEQSFDLQVHFPPSMTSLSGRDGTRGASYVDYFRILGGELDRLRAELIEGPPGMSTYLYARDGQVQWQADSPAPSQIDTLQLGARDGRADAAGFAAESLWNSGGNGIDTPVFGRLLDSNGDGVIDRRDRLVAVGLAGNRLTARYTDTGELLPWSGTPIACYYVVPAIADLDGDGKPEIVYCAGDHATLSAIDGNGARKWSADPVYGAPAYRNLQTSIEIADLDGNGTPEIVAAGRVYAADGSTLWSFGGTPPLALSSSAYHPLLSDLDGDGKKEVLFGSEVRRANGALYWSLPTDGMNAPVAEWGAFDFDGDGKKEVIASSSDGTVNRLERFNVAGTRLGTPVPLETGGGMPAVFDIDRDGSADIYLAWEQKAFALDGTLRHRGGTQLKRSQQSLADLNGDGAIDVLNGYDIVDLQSGWRWARAQSNVFTGGADRYGAGVLIDSNGDGNAELFVGGGTNTVERPRASIWPINGDGRSSLRSDAERYAGVFGVQGVPGKPSDLRFDLAVGDLHSHAGAQGGRVFEVTALNRGLRSMQQPVTVTLYAGPCDGGGHELQRRTLAPLHSNERVLVQFDEVPRDQLHGWTYACASHAEATADLRSDNNRVAAHLIDVRVNDGGAYSEDQLATVQVKQVPTYEMLSGSLPAQIYSGHEMSAQLSLSAVDPDQAPYFSLTNAPSGMRINPWTGVISWTPGAAQAGRYSFSVTAALFDGGGATLGLSTEVIASSNRPPQITSTPTGEALVDTAWRYAAQATDPDGDVLSFALAQAPAGMSIDAGSGLVQWTPTQAQLGTQAVQLRVSDPSGNVVTQSFSVLVKTAANITPVITSTPVMQGKAGHAYAYDVDAVHAGGATISYMLVQAPLGMSINSVSGLIAWTPSDAQVGAQLVSVRASAGTAYAVQNFSVQVLPRDATLQLGLQAAPRYLTLGQTAQITTVVSGAAGPYQVSASVDGQALALDASGNAAYTPTSLGAHSISAQANDPYDTATAQTIVYVSDPADTQAPIVHLSAPTDMSVITKPTAVVGTVDDAHLASWRLVLKDNQGATAYRTLASGSNTFSAATFATFDPTLLMNGLYVLVLEATDTGGLVTSDSVAVSVEGAMKVGHFSISFLDLEIPLSGIPIRVTRTYDTRRAHEALDFGYGWSIDYQNVSVRESRKLGFSWRLAQAGGGLTPWCVKPAGDPQVTVTLPDGSVEKFRARFEPECQAYVPTVYGSMKFEPVGNTHGTLEQLSYGTLRVVELGDGSSNLVDPDEPAKPADPDNYRLTTAEGLVYTLDQGFGIRTVQDQAGNTLTYSRDGVRHSNGVGIGFVRDAQQRITAITLPDGETLGYGYDAKGDLVSARDQLRHASTYGYWSSAQWPHYLNSITDPGQTVVARHEYDADGRLVASTDANGKRMVFNHQIAGHVEQVTNRRNYTSTYVYDDNGWVLSETNALGEQTLHTYDANGNELTTTDPLNRTTTRTFDARGNVLTETNPAGETVTRTWGRYNQLLTETDNAGRVVVSNRYYKNLANEETGFLRETTDALNHSTQFVLDLCNDPHACGNSGNVKAIIDARGKTRGFWYDAAGNVTSETDTLGNVTTRQVDAMGRVLSETQRRVVDGQAQELITRHEYDAAGHVTKTTAPDNTVTTRAYTTNGQLQNETSGNVWSAYTYTPDGRVAATQTSSGSYETTTYDPEGNVIEQRDRAGQRTRMVYDAANRLSTTIYPDATLSNEDDNPRTHQDYDAAGQLRAHWDEQDRPTEYRYDAAGRQTQVIDALGQVRRTRYDESGRREASVDALGRETHYVYDDAGRLTRTILPDAQSDDGNPDNNPHVDVTYDDLGRKIAETDVQGRATRYAYDTEGRLTAVVLPNPATGENPADIADTLSRGEDASAAIATSGVLVTRYGYDAQGRKLTQTDALGRTTSWAYDNVGRVVRRTLPLGQSETFVYDSAGDRTSETDFNGTLTRHTYDAAHRLTRTDYADGSALVFTYDLMDRPLTLSYQGLTETRHYDPRGRLDQVKWSDGQQLDYAYDAAGNRTQLNSGTRVVTFGYDALNRLQSISEAPSAALGQTGNAKITTYAYDANGNRDHVLHANGTRVDYAYDRMNRLTNLTHKKAAAILLSLGYALNPDGTRAGIAEQVQQRDSQGQYVVDAQGAPVLQATRTSSYRYDATKRLIEEAVSAADANQRRTTNWTYDSVGNRLTQTQVVPGGSIVPPSTTTTSYRYDRNDRLLDEATTKNGGAALTTNYRYDLNGNLLETAAPAAITTYRWNAQNRLTQAERKIGSVSDITQYAYTAEGIRRSSIVRAGTAQALETRSLIDPNQAYAQVIEERIGSPLSANGTYGSLALKAAYTVGDDRVNQYALRDANGNLLPNVGAPSGTPNPVAVGHTFHADGLGSTRLLTDSAGNVVDQYAYHAFGERDDLASVLADPTRAQTDFQYTGEQFDPNLGWYYLRARYSDPRVGRFKTMDVWEGRIEEPSTLNKYAYTGNDPIDSIDPSGMMTLGEMSETITVQGILNGLSRAVGAGAGILIGSRINNIVKSRAAARACAAKYSSSLQSFSSNDCSDVRMPIVFMSDLVMPGIGEHVQKSQALGSPAILNRTSLLKYTNRALNIAKCAIGLSMPVTFGGDSCDEYPFASTYQGGIGATVAKVPLLSNLIQGGVLSSFYSACLVEPDVFPLNEFLVLPVMQTPGTNFQCRFFGGR